MKESFNIYEFVNTMKNITPEEIWDMLFIPGCIFLAALCIGQFINSLIASWLERHFDEDELSIRYIILKSARGLPRAWIVGMTL